MRSSRIGAAIACAMVAMGPRAHAAATVEALADLSLEQLSQLEVTSVSKTTEPLRTAPASVYVITHDEILRSGATSLVEALRLAPNLQVSQYTGNYFVAGARGLAGAQEAQNFSNKLLLLIDGRSVYSPLFSGIYLDVQDVLLEDIDRIEVISGPGATLWGANAMHGVINVITRPAYMTEGALVSLDAGNLRDAVAARLGARLGAASAFRVYAKAFEREPTERVGGESARDGWHQLQGGFRFDSAEANDTWTASGDLYRADIDLQQPGGNGRNEGANALVRYTRSDEGRELQVQAYYDYTSRAAPGEGLAFRLNTFDVELQQRLTFERHRLIWGTGARLHKYSIDNTVPLAFLPRERELTLANIFAQDTIALGPAVDLALGLKAEHDSFSGWNLLPDVRVSWRASDRAMVWGAASRSIRSPTPFDTDVVERFGNLVYLTGNRAFDPEQVFTYEAGIRGQPHDRFTYSAAVFYNDYGNLRTIEPTDPVTLIPFRWDNRMEGSSHGLDAWGKWQVTRHWHLSPGVRWLEKDLEFTRNASALLGVWQAGNDPTHQWHLTSSTDFGHGVTLDATWRYVAALPEPQLDAYQTLNVSLGWHVGPELDLALTGFNLLGPRHLEYPAPSGNYVGRAVMLQARWRP